MALQLLNCGIRNGYQDANSRRRSFYSTQVCGSEKNLDAKCQFSKGSRVAFSNPDTHQQIFFFKNQYHEFSWEALEIIAAFKNQKKNCLQSVGKCVNIMDRSLILKASLSGGNFE